MECYCDGDHPEFYIKNDRKARKQHKCIECGEKIEIGESYEHVKGKWRDCIDSYKTCPDCVKIRDFLEISMPCFCWSHRSVLADAHEQLLEVGDCLKSEAPGVLFQIGRMVAKHRGKENIR